MPLRSGLGSRKQRWNGLLYSNPSEVILINLATDGVFTRSSSGSLFNGSTSSLVQVGPNVRRFEDRGDGHGAKYLTEGSRTNIIPQSEDWSVAPWAVGGVKTAGAGMAPDGTETATLISGTVGAQIWQQITSPTIHTTGSFYFFVKQFNTTTGVRAEVRNYANSVLTNAGSYLSTSADWEKREVIQTSATGTTTAYAGARLSTGQTAFLVWGAQYENAYFPSSYISTSTTSATRTIDSLVIPSGSYATSIAEMATTGFEFDIWPYAASGDIDTPSAVTIEIILAFDGFAGASYVGLIHTVGATKVRVARSGSVLLESDVISYSRNQKLTLKVYPTSGSVCALEISGASTGSGKKVGGANSNFTFPTGSIVIGAATQLTFNYFGRMSNIRRLT